MIDLIETFAGQANGPIQAPWEWTALTGSTVLPTIVDGIIDSPSHPTQTTGADRPLPAWFEQTGDWEITLDLECVSVSDELAPAILWGTSSRGNDVSCFEIRTNMHVPPTVSFHTYNFGGTTTSDNQISRPIHSPDRFTARYRKIGLELLVTRSSVRYGDEVVAQGTTDALPWEEMALGEKRLWIQFEPADGWTSGPLPRWKIHGFQVRKIAGRPVILGLDAFEDEEDDKLILIQGA